MYVHVSIIHVATCTCTFVYYCVELCLKRLSFFVGHLQFGQMMYSHLPQSERLPTLQKKVLDTHTHTHIVLPVSTLTPQVSQLQGEIDRVNQLITATEAQLASSHGNQDSFRHQLVCVCVRERERVWEGGREGGRELAAMTTVSPPHRDSTDRSGSHCSC